MTATAAGRMGATVASVNNFFIPVVALALGVGLRHEQVSWISIARRRRLPARRLADPAGAPLQRANRATIQQAG